MPELTKQQLNQFKSTLTKPEAELYSAYEKATSQNKINLDTKQVEMLTKIINKEISFHSTGKTKSFNVISDDLGLRGVLCPVDGKTYDSKSAYYKAVKASGMEIVGNDASVTKAQPKQTHDINWNQAVRESINQLK
jgi:hypothetical protein